MELVGSIASFLSLMGYDRSQEVALTSLPDLTGRRKWHSRDKVVSTLLYQLYVCPTMENHSS